MFLEASIRKPAVCLLSLTFFHFARAMYFLLFCALASGLAPKTFARLDNESHEGNTCYEHHLWPH